MGVALVGIFLILGFVRGLWWQVIRLLGLAGAVLLARTLSQRWESSLLSSFPELDPRYAQGILWILVFLAGLAVAALIGILGRKMLEALQLSLLDRTTGAVAGAATGLLLHCAVLAVFVQLGPADFVSNTVVDSYSEDLLHAVGRSYPLVVQAGEGSEIEHLLRWDLGAPPQPIPGD